MGQVQDPQNDMTLNQEDECETLWHHFNHDFDEVIIKDDIAFLASRSRGFVIADISDKTSPEIIHHQNIIGYTSDIALIDTSLFVLFGNISGHRFLWLLDVSTPNNPILISETIFGSNIFIEMCVDNNLAYLISNTELRILNVTNLALPSMVSSTPLSEPRNLIKRDDVIYVSSFDNHGISAYNVSQPSLPELMCNYNGSDSGLFSSFSAKCFEIDGDFLYANLIYGILVVNVTDPGNMTFCNYIVTEFQNFYYASIAITEDYIYMSQHLLGILVLDKNNNTHPIIAGSFNSFVFELLIVDDYLYTTYFALTIFDISDPLNNTFIGKLGVDSYTDTRKVAINSNFAYFTDMWSGLKIVDISNLTDSQIVGEYFNNYVLLDIEVISNRAFVYNYANGLDVLDISNVSSPMLLKRYSRFIINSVNASFKYIEKILLQDNYLYVLTSENIFVIIDISQPDSPVAVGSYSPTYDTYRFTVDDNKAYLGCDTRMLILDITNKANPKLAGIYTPDGSAEIGDIAVSGKYAIVGIDDALMVLNVGRASNVKQITKIDNYDGGNVGIAGKYVWASSLELKIYDLDNPEKPLDVTTFWDKDSTICVDPWYMGKYIMDVEIKDNIAFLTYAGNGFMIVQLPVFATGKIAIEFSVTIGSFLIVSFIAIFIRKKKR